MSAFRSTQRPLQTVWAFGGHPHSPRTQVAPSGHTRPQVPQLLRSIAVLVHTPAQLICPEAQPQLPAMQISVAAQARPHAPQFRTSLCWSTQAVPHIARGETQAAPAHLPIAHELPTVQAAPQAPQCVSLLASTTSHPLASAPSQLPKPSVQRKLH